MTYHIVCLTGSKDEYTPNLKKDDKVLVVPFNIPGHPDSFQTNIYDIFAQYGLSSSQIAHDLLNAVIAAYTADVRIAREDTFDGWTRSLILHLAVTCTRKITPTERRESNKINLGDSSYEKEDIY